MAEPARATTPAGAVESDMQEVLAFCQGDAMNALRVALIANAFLEAEIDRLNAEPSSGRARSNLG